MDTEIKQKWVKALRSGEYNQGVARLFNAHYNTYCCLGVLCDVMGYSKTSTCPNSDYQGFTDKLGATYIFTIVRKENQDLIGLDLDQESTLTHMNDAGQSFKEIADWIEKNL